MKDTTLSLRRRDALRAAGWGAGGSLAVVATGIAPAYAASNNSLQGILQVTTDKRTNGTARVTLDSSLSGSANGVLYGLYLFNAAGETYTDERIEVDLLGANIPDVFGQPNGSSWGNGIRLGNVVQRDGLTYTRFSFAYGGGLTPRTNPTRLELDDFVITSGFYNPPVGQNVTYWVRRFVTVSGVPRFFQRRNGDNGFIEYGGEGPGNGATPISGRVAAKGQATSDEVGEATETRAFV